MNWIEAVLIILGISLDIFGAVACQGALVEKIEKKHLVLVCTVVTVLQVGAIFIGNQASTFLLSIDGKEDSLFIGRIIASVIFLGLGVRLCFKAWKNEAILERRENVLTIKRFAKITMITSAYTVLTGIAFGFLTTNVWFIILLLICFTIAVVVSGLYTGYHFGFRPKTKAFLIGGIMLIIGGISVMIHYPGFY